MRTEQEIRDQIHQLKCDIEGDEEGAAEAEVRHDYFAARELRELRRRKERMVQALQWVLGETGTIWDTTKGEPHDWASRGLSHDHQLSQ